MHSIENPGVPAGEAAAAQDLAARLRRDRIVDSLARFGLVVVLVLIIVLFSALSPAQYFTGLNFEVIANNQAPTLLLSLAIMLPLIAGEFDLSVAANFGFCELLVVGLMLKEGLPWGAAVVVTLLVGGLIGVVNGLLVVMWRMNSFIATLGTATIIGGLQTWYSGGQVLTGNLSSGFLKLASVNIFGSLSIFVVYAVGLALIVWIGLNYLPSGRHLYATGGGRLAAVIMGIRTRWLIVAAFGLCGIVAAFTGIITASQLTAGQPDLGADYLLPAYAGAFLGATTINIGQFNVWGTVIGVYLLGAGVGGLEVLGFQSYVQDFFNGGALVVAVAASLYFARRRAAGPTGGRRREDEVDRGAVRFGGEDVAGRDRPAT